MRLFPPASPGRKLSSATRTTGTYFKYFLYLMQPTTSVEEHVMETQRMTAFLARELDFRKLHGSAHMKQLLIHKLSEQEIPLRTSNPFLKRKYFVS